MTTETIARVIDRGPTHPFAARPSEYVIRPGSAVLIPECWCGRPKDEHTETDIGEN